MPWVPAFNAVQEEGVIDNILFIVERDFKTALDYSFPIEAALTDSDPRYLRDFQERIWGKLRRLVFPALGVGPNRTASVLADAADQLIQAVGFTCWIGVTDDSEANVGRRATRYANTLEMVLRTAALKTKADFRRNMSTQMFGIILDEMEHVYLPVGSRESLYFQMVEVSGVLQFRER